MQKRFFITATGTGIGKTFITAALARQARERGHSAMAYKPVMTGGDASEKSDAAILLEALGLAVGDFSLKRVTPWAFKAPLAPSMAVKLENRRLDFNALLKTSREMTAGAQDVVLIEGIGGVMVPLDDQHTVLDWIAALEIPALLVTGSYLGTLSHTLTALSALAQRKIPLRAVIVNESEESPAPLAATAEELARWTKTRLLTVGRNQPADALRGLLD